MKNLIFLSVVILFSNNISASTSVELDCLVKPEVYIDLSSSTNSVIESLLVGAGDDIRKGQSLVKLEASVERAQVELAKQKVAAISDIEHRKEKRNYIKLNNQRIRALYANQSISLFDRDKSDTELVVANIELVKARDKRKIMRLELDLAQARLNLKTIRSPIDGLVADLYLVSGESVKDRPIMKLAKINPLRVELIAATEYFGLITSGMKVEIRPERPTNKSFVATVSVVDQLIDPASGTFTVRMTLPNANNELIGGVNCLAIFTL